MSNNTSINLFLLSCYLIFRAFRKHVPSQKHIFFFFILTKCSFRGRGRKGTNVIFGKAKNISFKHIQSQNISFQKDPKTFHRACLKIADQVLVSQQHFHDRTDACIAFWKDRRAQITPALKWFVVRLPKLIISLVGADTPWSDHVSMSSFRIVTGDAGLLVALTDADEKAEGICSFSASRYSIHAIGNTNYDTTFIYILEMSTAVFAVQRSSPVTHHLVRIWPGLSVVA